ncbi:hypothetical protein D1P53_001873 [Cryptococcus gattii VGV]|nr:hypothetical protein D1P53_001873 [Cryptococcus gattii VGV]
MARSSLSVARLTSLLFVAPLALAQSSGIIKFSSTSVCIIVAQIASLSSPSVVSAMVPICPDSDDTAIAWPLTTNGDGASSSIAIYAHTTATDGGVSVGCVMGLSQMQAMYLLGRDLTWNDSAGTLYDNTAGGNLLDPTTYATIICGSSDTLLRSGLVLPDPSSNAAGASVWDQTITLNAGAKVTGGSDNTITTGTIVKVSSAAAPASSTIPMTPAAATPSANLVTSAQPVTSPVRITSAAANELPTSAESLYTSDPIPTYQASSSHLQDFTPTSAQSSDSASFSATDENDYSFDIGDYSSTSVIAVQTNASLKASSLVVPWDNQHVTSFEASTYPPSTASLLSSVYPTDNNYEGSSDSNLSDSEVASRTSPLDSSSGPTSVPAAIASNTYPIPSHRSNGGITITALDARPSSTTQESSSQSGSGEAGLLSSSVSSYESQISPTRNDDNDSPSETDQSQPQYFEPSLSIVSFEQFPTPTFSHQLTTYALFHIPAPSSSASSDEPFVFTIGGITIGQFTEAGVGAVLAAQINAISTTGQGAIATAVAESSALAEATAAETIEWSDRTSASVSEVIVTLAAPTGSALVDANDGSSFTLANGSVSAGAATTSGGARETSDSNRSGEDNFDSYTSASTSTRADEPKVTGGSEGDVSTSAAFVDVSSTEAGNRMNLTRVPAVFVSETQAGRGTAKGKHKNYNKESGAAENTASVTVDNTTTAPTESSSLRTLSYSLGAEPTSMSPWVQAFSNNRNSSAFFWDVIVSAPSFIDGASYSLESGSPQKTVVAGAQSSGKTCARKRKEKARRDRALLMEAI